MKTSSTHRILTLLSLTLSTTMAIGTIGATSLPACAETGKETVDKLVQVFTTWKGNGPNKEAYDEAAKYIDYHAIAQRSLNTDEWKKLTPMQKDEFVKSLKALIEERYYIRWHKIFSKGSMAFVGEANSGGDTIVKTKLTLGKTIDPLEWRLNSSGNDHKVVSLDVNDSDLLKKLNGRLQGRFDKYGFNGLLGWMKDKANVGPNTQEASTGTAH